MGTIFAPTYAYLTMGYHEIKVYSIISQSYALASRHFQNSSFRYLDDCQIYICIYIYIYIVYIVYIYLYLSIYIYIYIHVYILYVYIDIYI